MNKLFTREDGFTLVEILVVILIIGILSAIAVPVFLNQRKTSNDAAVESDVSNASKVVETYFVNNPQAGIVDLVEIKKMMSKSRGVNLTFWGTRNDWCITGWSPDSKTYTNMPNDLNGYVIYISNKGGSGHKSVDLASLSCYNNRLSWTG